ncbi:MAG: rRNA pseudouridine synthase [Oscillospiraceae bacterium]|nr:rRNA pseudouridine synthase [Oscillospiraceae bacterium]
MQYRLDRLVCEVSGVSRADAKKLISKGLVKINGEIIRKADRKADDTDDIVINGRSYTHEKYVYIMLNKPEGVVSATGDKNDVTVVDLVKDDFPRRNLFPAGRLDKTSTGFVLITDDGSFAHDILSPKHHVPKTYIVTVDNPVTDRVVKAFEEGVTLADGTLLKSAEIIPSDDGLTATIILHQGVYHQIKRMLGVFDIGVNTLHRTAIGGLEMPADLVPGEYVKLTKQQVEMIAGVMLTEN